jgi:hypothetical protein
VGNGCTEEPHVMAGGLLLGQQHDLNPPSMPAAVDPRIFSFLLATQGNMDILWSTFIVGIHTMLLT